MSTRRRVVKRKEEEESVPSDSDSEEADEISEFGRRSRESQTGVERRALRVDYRKLISDLQGIGIEEDEEGNISHISASELSSAEIKKQLATVEHLYSRVTHTREAALDSQVYRIIASNAGQKIQRLRSEFINFDPEEFAEKLITHFEVDRVEFPRSIPDQVWGELHKRSSTMLRTAPTLFTFSGSFDVEEVAPTDKPRRKRKLHVPTDPSLLKPTIVQQLDPNDRQYDEQTTEEVENVYSTLWRFYKRHDFNPLCYFRFVIDPSSFSRTIENMFHTSFLVMGGNAKMFYDEYGLPVIMPVDKQNNKDGDLDSESDRFALAMGLSVREWNEIKVAFNLTDAAIRRKKQ